jgi:hypothetical protein
MIGRIMTRSGRWRSRLAAVLAAVALVAATAFASAPVSAEASAPKASAALASITGSDFNPGFIISDDLFYDSAAMTQAQIQSFLDGMIGTCTNGQCLNVLVTSVASRPQAISTSTGNVECDAFTGGTLSAAAIIYNAQVACDISARVILVTLQKEQGLVTKTAPSQSALDRAMGMACPDTAPCASYALGFGNQVYLGAKQLNTYKQAAFAIQPGIHSILYSPNSACGSSTVNIQNFATAALYSYTPYQPDAAALANLHGTGDGCSSYGNRNFWVYYNDWFGSTLGKPPVTVTNTTTGEPASYLLATDSAGSMNLYPSTGNASWLPSGVVGTGWTSMNSVFGIGDFNGDGHPDVLARDGAGTLWMYPRDGAGGWLPRVQIGSGWNIFSMIFPVGDFNSDGHPDVMAMQPNGQLWLYPGNGKGSWLPNVRIGSGWQDFTAVFGIGDFTGDGIPDVMARDSGGALWLYPGGGMKPANWKARSLVSSGWNAYNAVMSGGDLNGDHTDDVIARDSNGVLYLYPSDGAGNLGAARQIGSGWNGFTSITAIDPAAKTSTTVTPPVTPPVVPGSTALQPGVGDFDGDGNRDVLARDAAGNLWLYPGNGKGGWLSYHKIGSGWQGFTVIFGAGDLNGDRHPDILARDSAGTLWLYPGNGTGGFLPQVQVATNLNAYTTLFSPGDFDGDGKADMIGRDAAGDLWLFAGNGAGAFAAPKKIGAGWQIFSSIWAAGDANGDGKQDIFATEPNGALWLYPGNGSGGWGAYGKIGAGWQIFDSLVTVGDFDGDAHPDVLARQLNGALWLYPTSGNSGWKTYRVIGNGWQIFNWIG